MNSWNSEFVRSSFDKQAMGFITNAEGKIEIHHPAVGTEIRRLVIEEGACVDSPETVQRARESFLANSKKSGFRYMQPLFGYVVEWLSELGKTTELNALLAYADTRFNPAWEKGGLFYPRNDQIVDEDGEWTFVDPFSGNAAIGYARLNVEDGQKKMWESPWTRQEVAGRPWVDDIDFSQGVDCLRGCWDEELNAMVITLRSWNGKTNFINFSVRILDKGSWAVYERDNLVAVHQLMKQGGDIQVKGSIGPSEEVDFVVLSS